MTKKLYIIIFLITGIFIITSCDKKKNEESKIEINMADYTGLYEGLYTRYPNDSTGTKKRETFSLELYEDGTGKHNHNDTSYDITWSYDGYNFQMIEKYLDYEIEYTGTLKHNKIIVYDGEKDKSFTQEYVYLKE